MSNKLPYLRPVASYSSPLCLRLAIYHFKTELQLNFVRLSIPLRATAFKFATSNSFRFRHVRQLSSSLRPTALDSVTCDSFQVRYVQQLWIPLRATAFKFATSNSFRFRYVRQLSSSLRTTAFKLFFQCMNHSLIISVLTQDRLFCLHASLFVLFIQGE